MDTLIIEGLRCYSRRQRIRLKPLTLLVGENSTGKTTCLAALRLAWDIGAGMLYPDFNEGPFQLGGIREMAHRSDKAGGRLSEFSVGFEMKINQTTDSKHLGEQGRVVRFVRSFGKEEERISSAQTYIDFDPYRVGVMVNSMSGHAAIQVHTPDGSQDLDVPHGIQFDKLIIWDVIRNTIQTSPAVTGPRDSEGFGFTERHRDAITSVLAQMIREYPARPYAFDPVRSRPERVYDHIVDRQPWGGDHIPSVIASVFSYTGRGAGQLRKELNAFGEATGLYDSVEVRHLDEPGEGPFQINVRTSGTTINLVDVGYGVSQAIPFVVSTIQSPPGQIFLIQQPEVHLHPRAQAELGTFWGRMVREHHHRFVVETHSDYIVDRIRMDIRDRKGLTPDDVAIHYFERKGTEVVIHELRIDEYGNIHGAPPGYRDFFLVEERRYFGADECA
jgi:hypothetical protein